MIKNVLTFCLSLFLFTSCIEGPTELSNLNKKLTYKNIIIMSDLSSRIDNKPLKDIEEIHKILLFFKDECVKPGEKIGDRSSISFSAFSEKVAAKIDLDELDNVGVKQQFINSTNGFKNNGFVQKLKEFEENVKSVYANTRNPGLDLISVLIAKIEGEGIVKQDKFLTDSIDTTFVKYENHIYIFTDGYLEYDPKNTNKQFYFGRPEIQKVRSYCKTNNIALDKALEENSSIGLPPYKSKNNELVTLHIMETHERDKDDDLQSYKYQTGQRENEILEAVWKKWAKDSGFKDITWAKY
jgi:hypothetical protein